MLADQRPSGTGLQTESKHGFSVGTDAQAVRLLFGRGFRALGVRARRPGPRPHRAHAAEASEIAPDVRMVNGRPAALPGRTPAATVPAGEPGTDFSAGGRFPARDRPEPCRRGEGEACASQGQISREGEAVPKNSSEPFNGTETRCKVFENIIKKINKNIKIIEGG